MTDDLDRDKMLACLCAYRTAADVLLGGLVALHQRHDLATWLPVTGGELNDAVCSLRRAVLQMHQAVRDA